MNLPLMLNVRLNSEFQPQKNQTKHMRTKYAALLISLTALGALSVSANQVTYSGNLLSHTINPNISYSGAAGDAQYVAGPPAVAQLYTADLSVNGDSPALFVKLSAGMTLSSLTASYTLANGTTADPYWILYMTDDTGYTLPIVGTDATGKPLNGSSPIHVGNLVNGSISLLTLDSDIDPLSGLPYGGETVNYVGLELGDGGIGAGTANIASITIGSSAPDGASTLLLLSLGLAGLGVLGLRRNRLQSAK